MKRYRAWRIRRAAHRAFLLEERRLYALNALSFRHERCAVHAARLADAIRSLA